MSRVRAWFRRTFLPPPVIRSEHGVTTEWCRHRAAMNMAADPALRKRVEDALIEQYGSREYGLAECKRRYFEAY